MVPAAAPEAGPEPRTLQMGRSGMARNYLLFIDPAQSANVLAS
jgi:hypothetical protein